MHFSFKIIIPPISQYFVKTDKSSNFSEVGECMTKTEQSKSSKSSVQNKAP